MSSVITATTTTVATELVWLVEVNEEVSDGGTDYVACQKRDRDGKFAPKFEQAWLAADAKKATRLANRSFSSAKVELSGAFGVDADELFA